MVFQRSPGTQKCIEHRGLFGVWILVEVVDIKIYTERN